MKKTLREISKIVVVIMLLLAMDASLVINCVQAAELTKEKVYEIDYCDKVLKYKGIARGAVYVVYEDNGIQYPAYCINPERIGVGETDSYDVNINGYITDVMLWKIITNGYPYKTEGELGVADKKEAYLATKQAIYCYLDNRDVNQYTAIGESGVRTLNALKQIWNNAQKSTETKISNIVNIVPISSEWEQDNLNSKYISKTYKIEAPAPITMCNIEIKGENIPGGLILTDINNNLREDFISYEQFKILIPSSQLTHDGSFEISLKTKMDTKPVLYGVSPSSELQNYALTTFTYEDAHGSYIEEYNKNNAQIRILKREKDTNMPLKGVEFQLLNADKNVIYQSLTTDEKGEIILNNIEPGTYYLEETRTLQGYVLYDELIKININLNEQINVIINNSREKNIEVSKEETNIEVGQTEENISQKINYTDTNKEKNELNIKQEISGTNINKEVNDTNIKQEINKESTNIEIKDINIEQEVNKSNAIAETNNINVKQEINQSNIALQKNEAIIRRLPKTGM